eukprot:GHVL01038743.1.p1 GENE.GHVL01038743.1~~GHVL01038743.1.p1  ORF type:complete len:604 (+),score=179.11 GHVL01038743.1:81-1892(+)
MSNLLNPYFPVDSSADDDSSPPSPKVPANTDSNILNDTIEGSEDTTCPRGSEESAGGLIDNVTKAGDEWRRLMNNVLITSNSKNQTNDPLSNSKNQTNDPLSNSKYQTNDTLEEHNLGGFKPLTVRMLTSVVEAADGEENYALPDIRQLLLRPAEKSTMHQWIGMGYRREYPPWRQCYPVEQLLTDRYKYLQKKWLDRIMSARNMIWVELCQIYWILHSKMKPAIKWSKLRNVVTSPTAAAAVIEAVRTRWFSKNVSSSDETVTSETVTSETVKSTHLDRVNVTASSLITLKVIIDRHPLHRETIFLLLRDVIETACQANSDIQMLQKLMSLMTYLVANEDISPVTWLTNEISKIPPAVSRIFFYKIIKMVDPPVSRTFIQTLVNFISSVVSQSNEPKKYFLDDESILPSRGPPSPGTSDVSNSESDEDSMTSSKLRWSRARRIRDRVKYILKYAKLQKLDDHLQEKILNIEVFLKSLAPASPVTLKQPIEHQMTPTKKRPPPPIFTSSPSSRRCTNFLKQNLKENKRDVTPRGSEKNETAVTPRGRKKNETDETPRGSKKNETDVTPRGSKKNEIKEDTSSDESDVRLRSTTKKRVEESESD